MLTPYVPKPNQFTQKIGTLDCIDEFAMINDGNEGNNNNNNNFQTVQEDSGL